MYSRCILWPDQGCVYHELLVKKLEFYGIRDVLLNWFKSYVDDRKWRVHPKLLQSNNISYWHNVQHGVHQGDILGPLLFNLYINDIPMIIHKILDVIMFADNTGIMITANSQDELLQRFSHVLNHMSKWFHTNQHTWNWTKTKVLKFTSAKQPNRINLTYADHLLMEVETITFLGLQLDNQITWKKCIQLMLGKLSSACFLMRRLYYILNIGSLKIVYFAQFHWKVKYGIIFWGNQHDINKMFIFQKSILRIMLGLCYRSSCRARFKQLEILTVPFLYIFIPWHCLWPVILLTLQLVFLNSLHIQGRKIILKHHWLNLHWCKGALVILSWRHLLNCQWSLLNFNMTKCSSRLHWKSIYILMFFTLWMNFWHFGNASLSFLLLNNCA